MKFKRRRKDWLGKADVVVLICLLFAIYWALSTNTRPPIYPVEAFFALSPRTDFQISRDGKHLGYIESGVDTDGTPLRGLFVQSVIAGTPDAAARRISDERDGAIKGYAWKDSSTLLVYKEMRENRLARIIAIDADTGRSTSLATPQDGPVRLEDILLHDPHRVLISRDGADGVSTLMQVDVRDGQQTEIAALPENVIAWIEGDTGLARTAISRIGSDIWIYAQQDAESGLRAVLTVDFRTVFQPIRYAPGSGSLYVLSNRNRDKVALVKWNPGSPDAEELLFASDSSDVTGMDYSDVRAQVDSASYRDSRLAYHFFAARSELLHRKLRQRLDDRELVLSGSNADETLYIVRTSGDRDPGGEYLYHAPTETLTKLTLDTELIPPAALAGMQPVAYAARDGRDIEGYLTLPVGLEAKSLPCIVMPHRNPWGRDRWEYNPIVQLFANRGYCVMQMNYRGSTGYGRAFREAGFGQWGLEMQDDITDAANWLIATGVADANRIGIFGMNYGGYAAIAGAAFTPGMYGAAVSYGGMANLFTTYATVPHEWDGILPMIGEVLGDPIRDKGRLVATSPIFHLDRIRTPLFIAHGQSDARVPRAEIASMVRLLRQSGAQVKYMTKPGDHGGFSSASDKLQFYHSMVQFFDSKLAFVQE